MAISDIFESLFGDLTGQAKQKEAMANAYLDQLYQQAGRTDEITGVPVQLEGRDAALAALRQMQDISRQGGLTAEDRARLADIQRQTAQQEQSARQAIMQQQAARGALGGGAQMVQQLMAQQGAAGRQAQGGLQTAAEAQRRALEAIQQSGQMGTGLRGQDLQAAQAQNAIAQFNAAQRQAALGRQIGLGQQKYGAQMGQAESLREKQKRGEEGLGGLIGGIATMGAYNLLNPTSAQR